MLRRYSDAIRTFITILNFIMRMRQYHTRSYQYDQVRTCAREPGRSTDILDQISKTADRMYALFAMCNAISPSRLDDNIANIAKERYGEQISKMSRGGYVLCTSIERLIMNCRQEALAEFQELFLYACPKFITANSPPYEDPTAISTILAPTSPTESPQQTSAPQLDPTHRHLNLFLTDVAAHAPVPTLRSFLKLYTSLGAKKLANFLDADEEEMVQELMMMKQSSRQLSRISGNEKGLLDGEVIPTSDLDFVIDEVCVRASP